MSDATQKCPVCGAVNPARAKFCGECGAAFRAAASAPAASTARHGNPVLPWFLAGCAALAIHAVIIIVALKGGIAPASSGDMTNAGSGPSTPNAPFASSSGGRPPDLSQMTPREAADRLWNRVMTAQASGDTAQVGFFAPMAIQAYAQVTPIDPDARLHIGLINLAMHEPDKARAQADSIVRESPTHLFGPLLKAEVAERAGRQADARAAWRTFLQNYDAEMRKNLDEYQQHQAMLTEDHTRAQQAAAAGR